MQALAGLHVLSENAVLYRLQWWLQKGPINGDIKSHPRVFNVIVGAWRTDVGSHLPDL